MKPKLGRQEFSRSTGSLSMMGSLSREFQIVNLSACRPEESLNMGPTSVLPLHTPPSISLPLLNIIITLLTFLLGIVATLTGVAQNYAGLIVCRLVLGALEAGLFPGLTIYLTLFYTKREIALRVGYLFVSAAIAGSVGGLLAYG